MTKHMALAMMLVVGTAGTASGQSTATQNATVSATVVAALSMTKDADLSIGVVAPGDGTVTIDPATDAGAAAFSLTGQASQAITVTYALLSSATTPVANELYDAVSTTAMAFVPSAVVNNTNTQGGSTIASGGGTTIDTDGDKFIWVGGDLTVGGTQAAGSYSGTLTVTVAY